MLNFLAAGSLLAPPRRIAFCCKGSSHLERVQNCHPSSSPHQRLARAQSNTSGSSTPFAIPSEVGRAHLHITSGIDAPRPLRQQLLRGENSGNHPLPFCSVSRSKYFRCTVSNLVRHLPFTVVTKLTAAGET